MVKSSKSSSSNNSTGKSKFAVYDFDVDDDRVEKDAQKTLSKFKNRKPREFSTSPVNKYDFLRYCTFSTLYYRIYDLFFVLSKITFEKKICGFMDMVSRVCVVSCVG